MDENTLKEFFDFVQVRECDIDLDAPRTIIAFKDAYKIMSMHIKRLRPYLDAETFKLLTFNLWLHEYIVSGIDKTLYDKYDVASKAMIISSASNSGSSTSIQGFSSLEQGKFMLMDLWRTPYGRFAYSILESLQGIAVVLN